MNRHRIKMVLFVGKRKRANGRELPYGSKPYTMGFKQIVFNSNKPHECVKQIKRI